MVTQRVASIGLSPTLRINALAQEMRASGVDVLDFSAGQPDFPTPENVKRAGGLAIEQNKTRYTPNPGLPELRKAVAERIRVDHDLSYEADRILVSPGAKASLYFACMTWIEDGDDVLLPSPYWVSYPEQIRLAGGRTVPVRCPEERGFKLRVEDLEQARTERSRLLILNYPSNPTGACYTRDELEPIAEFCVRHDIRVIADEIYSKLVYDGLRFTSIAELGPELRERTLMINGMSKAYAMTGWRIGYAAGPKEAIAGMSRLQSHSTSNATSIAQWASIEALQACDEEVERRRVEFETRRNVIVERLRALNHVECVRPEGAFYVFPNISGWFGSRAGDTTIRSGEDMATWLLERAKVAVVPGDAFGSPDHVRISYAMSLPTIAAGMDRIEEALAALADG